MRRHIGQMSMIYEAVPILTAYAQNACVTEWAHSNGDPLFALRHSVVVLLCSVAPCWVVLCSGQRVTLPLRFDNRNHFSLIRLRTAISCQS